MSNRGERKLPCINDSFLCVSLFLRREEGRIELSVLFIFLFRTFLSVLPPGHSLSPPVRMKSPSFDEEGKRLATWKGL